MKIFFLVSIFFVLASGCTTYLDIISDAGPDAATDTDTDNDSDADTDESCENGGYWSIMPSPVSSDLDGVWGASSNDVWATGSNGVILHYDGVEWSVVEYDLASTLDYVHGTSANEIYAAGWEENETRVYRYDGSQWSRSDPGFSGKVRGFFVAGPGNAWAVGTNTNRARLWHLENGDWSETKEDDLEVFRDVWAATESSVFLLAENSVAIDYYTGDYFAELYAYSGGALDLLYTFTNSFDPTAMFGFDENDIYLIGSDWENLDVVIYRLKDGELAQIFSQAETNIEDIWGTEPDNLFAVGHQSDVGAAILHFDGDTWIQAELDITTGLNGIWGASRTDVFAVGNGGVILHYSCEEPEHDTDSQEYDWELLFETEGTEFYGFWGASPSDLFIASTTGVWRVLDETNAVEIWPETEPGRQNGVWGASNANVFSVGEGDLLGNGDSYLRIVHCNENECAKMDFDEILGSLTDVHGFSATDVYAVGYHYEGGYPQAIAVHYDGVSWQQMEVDSDTWLTGVWGAAPDNLYASGWTFEGDGEVEYGRLLHYDGVEWSIVQDNCDTRLYSIRGSSDNDVWAVGQHEAAPLTGVSPFGLVMRFDGEGWTDVLVDDNLGFDSVWASSEDEVYIGARRWNEVEASLETEVLKLVDDEWELLTVENGDFGDAIEGIWGQPGGPVFAITREATLLRYTPAN